MICKKCGRLLSDTEFQQRQAMCKYCRREADIKRKYGITQKQYIEMWKKQEGKCALCGESSDKYLDIDHDHKTGDIRGLLCRGCNLMLDEAIEKSITEGKLRGYLNNDNGFQC